MQAGDLQVRWVGLALAGAVLGGLASIPAKADAAIDIGLCPAVDRALDPNRDGDFEDGDNAAALAAAANCIGQDKGKGLFSQGYVLRRLNRTGEARAAIEAGLAAGGDVVAGQRLLCALDTDSGQYEQGRLACRKAIAAGPTRALGYYGLGNLEAAAGRWQDALAAYDQALRNGGEGDPALLFNKGVALKNLGRWADAATSFQAALALTPGSANMSAEVVRALIAAGEAEKAVAAADEGLRINPKSAVLQNIRGRALETLSRNQEAFSAYDAAVRLDPGSAGWVWDRGTLHEKLGRPKDALADYAKALQIDPKFESAYQYRAYLLMRLNQPQAALSDFNQLISLAPQNGRYWNDRANLLIQFGRDDPKASAQAASDVKQALTLDPNLLDALQNRAVLRFRSNDFAGAVEDYTSVLHKDPTLQSALFWRARAYTDLGRTQAAVMDYSVLLKINPGYMWAYNNRGAILVDRGDCEGALPDLERVIRDMPGQGMAWLGSAICAAKAPDGGVGWWNQHRDRWNAAPDTADKHLAAAYWGFVRGNTLEANVQAEKAAALEPSNPWVKKIQQALANQDQAEVNALMGALDQLSGN